MSDFLTINAQLALSKAPEAALNTMHVLAADFNGAVTTALNVGLPNVEKIANEGLIGDGNEWEDDFINDYVSNPTMTLSDRLNTEQFAILAARHLGGAIAHNDLTGAWDHTIEMAASSADPTPKSSTVAGKFGGLDLLFGGMIVNSLGISFADAAQPTYSAELIGTGLWEYMADQVPPLVLPNPIVRISVNLSSDSGAS